MTYNPKDKLLLQHQAVFGIAVEVLENGTLPNKAHKTDAGFDLFASVDFTVLPGQTVKHSLDIKFNIPAGCWLRIESKSGLGAKGLLVYAGVIDEGYRGVVCAIVNHLNTYDGGPLHFKKGDKIAQLTANPHNNEFYMYQVDKVSDDTDRGSGGFGSTGR